MSKRALNDFSEDFLRTGLHNVDRVLNRVKHYARPINPDSIEKITQTMCCHLAKNISRKNTHLPLVHIALNATFKNGRYDLNIVESCVTDASYKNIVVRPDIGDERFAACVVQRVEKDCCSENPIVVFSAGRLFNKERNELSFVKFYVMLCSEDSREEEASHEWVESCFNPADIRESRKSPTLNCAVFFETAEEAWDPILCFASRSELGLGSLEYVEDIFVSEVARTGELIACNLIDAEWNRMLGFTTEFDRVHVRAFINTDALDEHNWSLVLAQPLAETKSGRIPVNTVWVCMKTSWTGRYPVVRSRGPINARLFLGPVQIPDNNIWGGKCSHTPKWYKDDAAAIMKDKNIHIEQNGVEMKKSGKIE